MEVLKTVVLSLAFGALGVALAVYLLVRWVRNRAESEDDEEDSGGGWITESGAAPRDVGRPGTGWLEFTRDDGEGVPVALPVNKIEYVTKKENGLAYIGCYKVKRKKEMYFVGYDTKESYEEIMKRLKGEEGAGE
ncbi:MAG: hypothetical protein K2N74_05765 [Clostridiales bacterium]|nr:hypothetical protein [Clostridiales bacterium]